MSRRNFSVGASALLLAKAADVTVRARKGRQPTYIYPEDFGARGDGTTNDATALQAALDALTGNKTLVIRANRVYNHNVVLNWTTTGSIVGPGRIHATVETASAFKILGTNQHLGNVTFSSVNTGRGTTWEEMKVLLYFCTGAHLTGTVVASSRCAAFFCESATNCILDNVVVVGSRADGIHMTGASTGMRVNNPSVSNPGDDGVAVVSYAVSNAAPSGTPCSDIVVTNPVIRNSSARGMSVVGGTNIQYLNVDIDGTAAAGLYLSSEATPATGFNTENTSNVTATVASLANCNNNPSIDQGDIFFYCGINRSVSGIAISGYPAGANGAITSTDTASNFHIGGRAEDGTGSVAATVSNMRITPNDAKPLKFEGTNTTITLSNVSY